MSDFQRVASLSELTPQQPKGVYLNGKKIAVYIVDGQPYATDNECTHASCLLSDVGFVEGEEVECGCHASQFNIKTGAVTSPPASEPLATYPVRVEGDDVLIEI